MQTLKPVYEQLTTIENDSSRNNKIALIGKYLQDPMFKQVITYALSSDKVFHMESFPAFKQTGKAIGVEPHGVHCIFAFLDQLNEQPGASAQDKARLHYLACIDKETYEVVKRIVKKDLKCGVGAKSINAAVPGTIYYVPYCRCSSDKVEDKFWKGGGKRYAQLKEDGMFSNNIIDTNVTSLSRNGKPINQIARLQERLFEAGHSLPPCVYTGEFLIIRDNQILNRQTGNGILNKLIHGTAPQQEADMVAARIWDAVPIRDFWDNYECTTPYNERFKQVKELVKRFDDPLFLDVVYTEEIDSKEEGRDFYQRMRKLKHEGAVFKHPDAKWADHTSPWMMKAKNVSSCALILVGWKAGKADSKYEDVMGALFFESACGKLKVTINGKDDEMRGIDFDTMIGSFWTVEFERVSYAKNKTTASLYLPRLQKARPDRNAADSLKEIIAREKKKEE